MNADDVTDVLRLLAGHWPNPALGEDEVRVWTRTLAQREMATSVRVIDMLAATGRQWRPTDGEFLAEYRHALPRSAPIDRETAPELPVTTEKRSREEWRDLIKKQLASANGPMVHPLAKAVSKSHFDNQHATDSPASRALALEDSAPFRAQQAAWMAEHPDVEVAK